MSMLVVVTGLLRVRYRPAGRPVGGLFSAGEEVGVPVEVVRPSLACADTVADAGPAVAVPVEVAVFDVDAGAVLGERGERDFDLAGLVLVSLDLPVGADVPAEHEPGMRFVGQHACPAAFAAVGAAVDDVAPDVGLHDGLGDGHREQVVVGWLERAEVTCEHLECAFPGCVDLDRGVHRGGFGRLGHRFSPGGWWTWLVCSLLVGSGCSTARLYAVRVSFQNASSSARIWRR